MAVFELPGADLANNSFVNAVDLDLKFAAIETVLNGGLTNDHCSTVMALGAEKIGAGGAVLQSEVTTTGAADKIPKLNSSGHLVVNRLIFKS